MKKLIELNCMLNTAAISEKPMKKSPKTKLAASKMKRVIPNLSISSFLNVF